MAVVIPLKLVYTPVDATVTAIRNYQVPSTKARTRETVSYNGSGWDVSRRYPDEAERVHVVLSRESGLPVSVLACQETVWNSAR